MSRAAVPPDSPDSPGPPARGTIYARDRCDSGSESLYLRSWAQRRVLWPVLGVKSGMLTVGIVAGLLARPTALLADCLDMLGDALGYALSLCAVGRGIPRAAVAYAVEDNPDLAALRAHAMERNVDPPRSGCRLVPRCGSRPSLRRGPR